MKFFKNPFLFFYFVIGSCCFNSVTLYSQQKKDSSNYYYYKVTNPKTTSDLLSGYKFYNQDKINALSKKDTIRAINSLRMVAISQLEMGLIYESESSVIEALTLSKHLKVKDSVNNPEIGLYNHLGKVYRASYDYDNALEVYNTSLQLSKSLKDSITIINNKANVYTELQDYENAIDQFTIVYNKCIDNNNPLQLARVLNNLGYVQSKMSPNVGLSNLKKGLKIRLAENDIIGIYSSYKNLAHYYLDRNNKQQALFYANKGLETVKQINSPSYLQDALSLIMELDNNPKVVEYKKLSDSIAKAKQLQRNVYSFNKYRYDEQKKIAQLQELQKEKEKRLKLLYQALAGLIFIVLVFSYFIFKARNKKEKLEQIYKTESRISKKIHDEVANDMYSVITTLQKTPSASEKVLDAIEKIYNKTRDISKENAAIDIEDYPEMLMDLLVSYKNDEISVITKGFAKINWDKITKLQKTTIYRVLQELMTNMRKHSAATLVALTFKQENNKLTIEYTDNGLGGELKKQVGLRNTETRMESINGSIIFDSKINKGFKAKITV